MEERYVLGSHSLSVSESSVLSSLVEEELATLSAGQVDPMTGKADSESTLP